ncbi:hypothetical protein TNCT_251621 [Trichonephila clavata]|uniref:Uncharacterized protein n=1 Tax=Trichonephila clavata TaxID=2740835 RepID=A0A8X6GMU8_TRICU|nr:hypothetical protein TNCT_251621 [Trichonephila clavata]
MLSSLPTATISDIIHNRPRLLKRPSIWKSVLSGSIIPSTTPPICDCLSNDIRCRRQHSKMIDTPLFEHSGDSQDLRQFWPIRDHNQKSEFRDLFFFCLSTKRVSF